jgi:hypothetical protein
MNFFRFSRRASGKVNRARLARPASSRLWLEALEDRITPSSVSLFGAILEVDARSPGLGTTSFEVNSSGGVLVTLDGQSFSFDPSQVQAIEVGAAVQETVQVNALPAAVIGGIRITCTGSNRVVIGNGGFDAIQTTVNVAGNGSTTLELDDSSTSPSCFYDVGTDILGSPFVSRIFSGTPFGFFEATYSGIQTLSLTGGTGGNTFEIETMTAGTSYHIRGGKGSDLINVGGGPSGNTPVPSGQLTIDESELRGAAQDTLDIDDSGGSTGNTYAIEGIVRPLLLGSGVSISRGSLSVSAFHCSIEVDGGTGNDTFNISPTAENLDTFATNLTINDVGGNNALNIDDQNAPVAENYAIVNSFGTANYQTSRMTPGGTTLQINTAGIKTVMVNGSNASSTFNVPTITNGHTITVNAGQGVNNINLGTAAGGLGQIQGLLNVTGNPGGFTTLIVNDAANVAARGFLLVNSGVTFGLGRVSYASIEALDIDAGSGGNDVAILDSPVGLFTTINAGTGGDTIHAGGSLVGDISPVHGPLVINGQGNATFTVFDQTTSTSQAYTLTGTSTGASIGRSGGFLATCNNIKSLTVNGGSGGNQFFVTAMPPTTPVTLNGGSGFNGLTGPNVVNLWSIRGAGSGTLGSTITFNAMSSLAGGSSDDTFKFGPAGSLAGTLNGVAGNDTVDYSAVAGPVTVDLQPGASSLIPGGAVNIENWIGTAASDTFTGSNASTNWVINGPNRGMAGGVAFTGFENLVGGSGVDVFSFTGSGRLDGSLSGGPAPLHRGNWLDYSGFSGPVTVNLQTGTATAIAGRVFGIQNVHGSNSRSTLIGNRQGNILIGGTGSDTITGGTGPSILIGDLGADSVTGGSGGDILIGDATTFDTMTTANENALMGFLAEWQSADSYNTRFLKINTPPPGIIGSLSPILRFGTTVRDDGAADTVTAAPSTQALDWFFKGAGDTLVNVEPGEHINNNTPAAFQNRTVTSPIDEGSIATVSGTITDPDPHDRFTLKVTWGDGTPTETFDFPPGSNGLRVSESHRYREAGSYAIQLFWTDPTGPGNQATLNIVVNDVAPAVDAGGDVTIKTGQSFQRLGSFTDPGNGTWTATVDYGDGTGPQPLSLEGHRFHLVHRFQHAGTYQVVVTVLDDDGGVGMASFDVTVA